MTGRLDDLAARATAQSLDEILAELDALPESRARSLALDGIDALVQLYGEGLARLVAAHRGARLTDELLATDPVVSRLLDGHMLLPPVPPMPPLVQLERRRANEDDESLIGADEATECQLCAAPIGGEHRHLLDLDERALCCACTACALLFDGRNDGQGAARGRYRLIPRRYRSLDRSLLDDGLWERLELPVDVVFMFMNSALGRAVAFYPGPMGTTESALPLPAWNELVAKSPTLATLEADVEALLVRRTRGARDYWILPVDECYRLAGGMRLTWEGISGGDRMRKSVDKFFARLTRHDARAPRTTIAETADHTLEREASCQTT